MVERGLVLLGQAVISPPSIARVRVKGKSLPEDENSGFRKTKVKKLDSGRKAKQKVSASHTLSLTQQPKGGGAQPTGGLNPAQFPNHNTESICGIAKSIQLTGNTHRRTRRRSSCYTGSKTRQSHGNPLSRRGSHTSANTAQQQPAPANASFEGSNGRVITRSPYLDNVRASRCQSAGSIHLHSQGKLENPWVPGGGGGSQRRRNMSGSSMNFSQRRVHAQVEVLVKETRSRDQHCTTPVNKRRLSRSQLRDQQKQKRLSTAEKKARQARIEEMILIQQQKAILRVEERKKHAIAQRQRAELEEQERRHKARERYRIREAEQERRRKHIYALNCIMRQVEERCFESFKETMETKKASSGVSSSHSSSADDVSDCESIDHSDCEHEESEDSGDTTIQLACKI